MTNRSHATKNLLLSELKNNLKQFENAKKISLNYLIQAFELQPIALKAAAILTLPSTLNFA